MVYLEFSCFSSTFWQFIYLNVSGETHRQGWRAEWGVIWFGNSRMKVRDDVQMQMLFTIIITWLFPFYILVLKFVPLQKKKNAKFFPNKIMSVFNIQLNPWLWPPKGVLGCTEVSVCQETVSCSQADQQERIAEHSSSYCSSFHSSLHLTVQNRDSLLNKKAN